MTKTLFRFVFVVALMAVLAGCSSGYTDQEREGGISPSAAEQQLLAIKGVTAADYRTAPYENPGEGGLGASRGMNVFLDLTIDPGYSIADPADFYDFLARLVWSVNDHYPKGSVVLSIDGGIDPEYDWSPTVRQVLGLDDHDYPWRAFAEEISATSNRFGDALGRWPSEPVDTPGGLLLHEAPVVSEYPAIDGAQVVLTGGADPGQSCYRVDFRRLEGARERYDGSVTVALLSPDGVELGSAASGAGADATRVLFCFPNDALPLGPHATLTAEPTTGFAGTVIETD